MIQNLLHRTEWAVIYNISRKPTSKPDRIRGICGIRQSDQYNLKKSILRL